VFPASCGETEEILFAFVQGITEESIFRQMIIPDIFSDYFRGNPQHRSIGIAEMHCIPGRNYFGQQ